MQWANGLHRDRKGVAMKCRVRLTARENRFLGHVLAGRSASAVAELEDLSIPEVRQQLRSILRKLDRGSGPKSARILPFDRNAQSS